MYKVEVYQPHKFGSGRAWRQHLLNSGEAPWLHHTAGDTMVRVCVRRDHTVRREDSTHGSGSLFYNNSPLLTGTNQSLKKGSVPSDLVTLH
jgi:hypothetical protein